MKVGGHEGRLGDHWLENGSRTSDEVVGRHQRTLLRDHEERCRRRRGDEGSRGHSLRLEDGSEP